MAYTDVEKKMLEAAGEIDRKSDSAKLTARIKSGKKATPKVTLPKANKDASKTATEKKLDNKKKQTQKKATATAAASSILKDTETGKKPASPAAQKAAKTIADSQKNTLNRNGSGKANKTKQANAKKTLESLKEVSKPTVKTAENYDSNPYTKEKTDAMWNRMATGDTASDKFGRVYAGIGQGVVDANLAIPNLVGKLATGKDVNLQERMGLNIDNEALKETAGFKRGKFAGEMIGYGMQNVAAAPAINGILANTKLGQMAAKSGTKMATNTRIGKLVGEEAAKDFTTGLARNAVEAGTVGLAQNIGIADQEGRTGLDLVGNVLLNTAADLTFGGLMEGVGLGVNAVKGAKALRKATGEIAEGVQTKTLSTGEEVPVNAEKVVVKSTEPVTEVAGEVAPTRRTLSRDKLRVTTKPIEDVGYHAGDLGKAEMKYEFTGDDAMEGEVNMLDNRLKAAENRRLDRGVNGRKLKPNPSGTETVTSTFKTASSKIDEIKPGENTNINGVRISRVGEHDLYVVDGKHGMAYSLRKKEAAEFIAEPDLKEESLLAKKLYRETGSKKALEKHSSLENIIYAQTRKKIKTNTVTPKTEPPLKSVGSRKLKPNGADVARDKAVYKTSDSIANREIDNEYMYETTTHDKRNRAAAERMATDYEGEIDDLLNKEHYTDEDFATVKRAFDSEMEAGNTDRARRLMRKAAEHSSEKGQELEAVKHLKENTVEGKVYKAQQEAVRGEKKARESDPKRFKKIDSETKEVSDIIRDAAKQTDNKEDFVESVRSGIDDLLKSKGKKNVEKVPLREQVLKLLERMDYDSEQVVDGLIDDVGDLIKQKNGIATLTSEQAEKIADFMKKAEEATDDYQRRRFIAEANQIIADIQDATWHDKFRSIQRISLLSNPKTLFTRNAGGNLLLMAAENMKNIPATMFDQLVSLKTGQRTTTLTGGGMAQLKGLKKGVVEQAKDIKYGVDTSPSRSQYELPNKTIWDVNKSKNKVTRVGTATMNLFDNIIGKSLQFGDRPFYEAAYQGRKAELEKLVKKGKATLTAAEIEESAKLFALDRTFQGNTWLAQRASAIKRPLGIVGDLVMPFTQTPANILDKLLDYAPTGLGKALLELGKTRKGTFDQKRFVDILGRTFTGSGAIMLGYSLYNKGLMTTDIYSETGGDEEYAARSFAGEQDYSLKLGDTYISVNWADPVGSLLMIGADFAHSMGSSDELLTALYGSTKAAANGVFDRSFMSGLTNLLGGKGEIADKLIDGMIEQTSQLTPNIGVAITKIIDPVKRETYDANPFKKQLNVLKSRTPGLSKTLPAKKDITGETVYQYQGRSTKDRALEALLLPYNKTVANDNEANDHLLKIYRETGDKGVLLDTADKQFEYDGNVYKLKNAEDYSRFQEVQGKAATEAIKSLIKTDEYKAMSDSDKAKALTSAVKAARETAREDFLIKTGAYTSESYAYSTLNDTQKEAVDSGTVSAVKLRGLKEKAAENGVNGNSAGVSIALTLKGASLKEMQAFSDNVSEKHIQNANSLKAYGYTAESFEAEKAYIYDKYDKDGNGSLKREGELDAYFRDKGYNSGKSNALYRAITGRDSNPY